MVSIKVILDKRRSMNDGSYPISFQICYNRKTRTRSSKIYVNVELWDDVHKEIKKAHPNAKILNQKLKKMFADIQSELLLTDEDKLSDYLKPKQPVVKVEKMIKVETKTVYQFATDLIKDLKSSNKFGNAWVYEATVNALKGFHPDINLYFEQIDYGFLTAYQNYLNSRDIKPNSVYLYVRTIRIFYNKAIKLKLADKSLYPFDDFKLKSQKTRNVL